MKLKRGKKIMKKWYKVVCEESFCDDMVGSINEDMDRAIKLNFGKYTGEAIFYKYQVIYEGEY